MDYSKWSYWVKNSRLFQKTALIIDHQDQQIWHRWKILFGVMSKVKSINRIHNQFIGYNMKWFISRESLKNRKLLMVFFITPNTAVLPINSNNNFFVRYKHSSICIIKTCYLVYINQSTTFLQQFYIVSNFNLLK